MPIDQEQSIDPTLLESMLRTMFRIRIFEEALYNAFMTEKMPGTMHQAIGMEAIPTGVAHALQPDDKMTSTHRGHGHAIAKGIPTDRLMAEMYAKSTGSSGGMGGSLHIFDAAKGFLGTTGVVGAGVPIATGAALAAQLEGNRQVVACFFGDGAANQGAVHEGLNLAAVWHLPIVFICENNRYAVSMSVEKSFAIENISERAAAYGMPGVTINGNEVLEVYQAVFEAVSYAREGHGPSFIECLSYRYKGHSRFEPGNYRPPGELEAWQRRDPILRFRDYLQQTGFVSEDTANAIEAEIKKEIEIALIFAKSSAPASFEDVPDLVFEH